MHLSCGAEPLPPKFHIYSIKITFIKPSAFSLLDGDNAEKKIGMLLILLDNSSDEKAYQMKKAVEAKCKENSMKSNQTLFSIVYLVIIHFQFS